MARKRIGILTGGGDVPGLNAVIKSVTYRGSENDIEVVGLRRGWEALTHLNLEDPTSRSHYLIPLNRENTRNSDGYLAIGARNDAINAKALVVAEQRGNVVAVRGRVEFDHAVAGRVVHIDDMETEPFDHRGQHQPGAVHGIGKGDAHSWKERLMFRWKVMPFCSQSSRRLGFHQHAVQF